eukprot:TRINITY_DN41668_c0_g1_i1.p1 TRINITY_DN41668_c0_g1~~TRINITY_DN41668_c0_g1_i1.p1  ORF type:complete len:341 (-),score=60.78 TRINITY_DN41668_c0_g1_i1:58-1080(-)
MGWRREMSGGSCGQLCLLGAVARLAVLWRCCCSEAQPLQPSATDEPLARLLRRPRVLLLGDSLTEQGGDFGRGGWCLLLSAYLSRRADVLNRGFSGYNTDQLHDMLGAGPATSRDAHLGAPPVGGVDAVDAVELAVVLLGSNDAVAPGRPAHVPLPRYVQNIREIVHTLEVKLRVKAVVLMTPPAVEEEVVNSFPWYAPDQRTLARTAEYAEALRSLTRELQAERSESCAAYKAGRRSGPTGPHKACIVEVDLNGVMMAQGQEFTHSLLADGLHFNWEGNIFVFNRLMWTLHEKLAWPQNSQEWSPTLLPLHFPKFAHDYIPNGSTCAWPDAQTLRYCER